MYPIGILPQWSDDHGCLHFPSSHSWADDVSGMAVVGNSRLIFASAAYVKGRDQFRANGRAANIGAWAFGFEWAAFTCLLLATIFFCVGGSAAKSDKTGTKKSRAGFFGGKRSDSTRSRGSFVNGNKEYTTV